MNGSNIHIIFGTGVRVTQGEVEAVDKYLESNGLTGFWGLGPLEGSGKPDLYVYPSDEDGKRARGRRKLLPNAKGELANVRGLKTILAMVGTGVKVEQQDEEESHPAPVPSDSGEALDVQLQELERLLSLQSAGGEQPAEAAFVDPAWDLFECGV